MSVQHQLDFMHHNALATFKDLATDHQNNFIQLLDVMRSVFRNVYFPLSEIVRAICCDIHYRDEATASELIDHSVRVTVTNIHALRNAMDEGKQIAPEPDFIADMRLISLDEATPASNSNLLFAEIDRSGIEKSVFQTAAIIKNILEISNNCGGNTWLAEGGKVLAARFPFSPAKEIMLVIRPSNELSLRSPD